MARTISRANLDERIATPEKRAGVWNSEDIVRKPSVIVLLLAALALSACGTSTGDRGLSGAAIGAGAGAAAAAIFGGPVAAVALVGAGAGALTGMATSPNSVDLGKPIWQH